MSDNTPLLPGSGGDVIRSIEKNGVKTQVVILDTGLLGDESLFDAANLLDIARALGTTSDGDVLPPKLQDNCSATARLKTLTLQMAELIEEQSTTQNILFQILLVLTKNQDETIGS
jgi:hypothetical protein